MGSFSWYKADNLTNVENVAYGKKFKFLIPKKFGGGHIVEKYQDYGHLGTKDDGTEKYDMYELLAFWNKAKGLAWDESVSAEPPLMKEIDEYTDNNRDIGIDIGCYDEQMANLQYPLKLVSVSYNGTYEDLDSFSASDPD